MLLARLDWYRHQVAYDWVLAVTRATTSFLECALGHRSAIDGSVKTTMLVLPLLFGNLMESLLMLVIQTSLLAMALTLGSLPVYHHALHTCMA